MKQLLVIIIACCVQAGYAQRSLNVLDWKPETTLNNYLIQQMHAQYDARRSAFAKALLSPQNLRSYIRTARERYLGLLGELPAKTALNPVMAGKITGDGYTIEKISYESFPSHHVTANLYVPKGKGPFPAVLLFCGHEDISKGTESYQQAAILFAQHGFMVLVADPVSQSERHQLTDDAGKPLTRGGTTEHTLLNEASNLLGNSTPADELWDNVRSLDYLVTRPEVDTARIGCIGNSGGAMQTIYFAGFDTRIKVMAPCSYLATRERTLELTGPADGCAQMPGEGKAMLEFADYLLMAAPKPILILAGRYDFIDYRGTEEAYAELKKAYTLLGQPGKVKLFTYDDGHGISQSKREAAVAWFCRWLKKENITVKEKSMATKTPAELFATKTGQVVSSFTAEKNIVQRNRSSFRSLEAQRKSFAGKTTQQKLAFIAALTGINDSLHTVTIEDKGTVNEHGLQFHKHIIRKDHEPPLPVLILYPDDRPKQVMLWCGEEGKATANTDELRSLLKQGYAIILADLRGTGETEDRAEFNDPKYYNREYRNAMLALHTGSSLVGQRTTDILTVLDMVSSGKIVASLPVRIKASGITTIPAIHAALFREEIIALYLAKNIGSYQEVFSNPLAKDWYSYVIPGVLKYYDIPDITQWIGHDKIYTGK